MSKSIKRPYEQVKPIAHTLLSRFSPYCERIEIAGSLRRKRPMIGDIEIVAIPTLHRVSLLDGDEASYDNLLHSYLDRLLLAGHIEKRLNKRGHPIAWGERFRAFSLQSLRGDRYGVDLFMCDQATWANTLTIRTGSAEFSAWLVRQQQAGGACPPDMQFRDSRLWRDGNMLDTPDEASIFTELGLPYIAPERRDDNLWLIDLRMEASAE